MTVTVTKFTCNFCFLRFLQLYAVSIRQYGGVRYWCYLHNRSKGLYSIVYCVLLVAGFLFDTKLNCITVASTYWWYLCIQRYRMHRCVLIAWLFFRRSFHYCVTMTTFVPKAFYRLHSHTFFIPKLMLWLGLIVVVDFEEIEWRLSVKYWPTDVSRGTN